MASDLSPAAELRQAAGRMRADRTAMLTALGCTGDEQWQVRRCLASVTGEIGSPWVPGCPCQIVAVTPGREGVSPVADAEEGKPEVAAYLMSWHPGVALAVADWLEATATEADGYSKPARGDDPSARACDRCGEWLGLSDCTCWDAALKVARAYSGTAEVPGARD